MLFLVHHTTLQLMVYQSRRILVPAAFRVTMFLSRNDCYINPIYWETTCKPICWFDQLKRWAYFKAFIEMHRQKKNFEEEAYRFLHPKPKKSLSKFSSIDTKRIIYPKIGQSEKDIAQFEVIRCNQDIFIRVVQEQSDEEYAMKTLDAIMVVIKIVFHYSMPNLTFATSSYDSIQIPNGGADVSVFAYSELSNLLFYYPGINVKDFYGEFLKGINRVSFCVCFPLSPYSDRNANRYYKIVENFIRFFYNSTGIECDDDNFDILLGQCSSYIDRRDFSLKFPDFSFKMRVPVDRLWSTTITSQNSDALIFIDDNYESDDGSSDDDSVHFSDDDPHFIPPRQLDTSDPLGAIILASMPELLIRYDCFSHRSLALINNMELDLGSILPECKPIHDFPSFMAFCIRIKENCEKLEFLRFIASQYLKYEIDNLQAILMTNKVNFLPFSLGSLSALKPAGVLSSLNGKHTFESLDYNRQMADKMYSKFELFLNIESPSSTKCSFAKAISGFARVLLLLDIECIENEKAKEENGRQEWTCVACLTLTPKVYFSNCGHSPWCLACFMYLVSDERMSTIPCPICRSVEIKKIIILTYNDKFYEDFCLVACSKCSNEPRYIDSETHVLDLCDACHKVAPIDKKYYKVY